MTSTPLTPPHRPRRRHITPLGFSAGFWLLAAVVGQWAFALYIAIFFGAPLVAGDIAQWNDQVLLSVPPVVAGKALDTAAFGAHAIGGGLIMVIGALQLMPFVRNNFRRFHHWNGRLFVALVIALSLSGFYLTWVRGPVPDTLLELSTSANGVLILAFAALAIRAAMQRSFEAHERWAVRLYLVSNAQWFLRIGAFGYFAIASGLEMEVSFDSPFFEFWMWGCFLVPLAIAELYFWAKSSDRTPVRWSVAALLTVSAVLTALGSAIFTLFSIQLIQGTVSL